MSETPEHLKTVKEKLAPLRALLKKRRELEAYFDELAEATGVEDRRKDLQATVDEAATALAALGTELEEHDPDATVELQECRAEIELVVDRAKREARKLGAQYLGDTSRLHAFGVKVTISKVSTHVEYDPKILEELPGLIDMEVDGDPVVEKRLNGVLLDRLLTKGVLNSKVAEKYRMLVKEKNPTVRIDLNAGDNASP